MIRMTKILVAAATVIGLPYGAEAADLSAPTVVPYSPPATVVESVASSGWYLRGDVGVGIASLSRFTDVSIDQNKDPNVASARWRDKGIGSSANIGVGVGYQFNDYLRGDVTLQYRASTSFHASSLITSTSNPPAYVQNSTSGNLTSTVAMANAYWDIGHFNGLTPYLGAGIGAAYNHIGQTYDLTAGSFNTQYGRYEDKGTVNLAYALHAGLAYDINSRLKLEAGYTYLNLGSAKTGDLTCTSAQGPAHCQDTLRIKNLSSNDFHIGMRWLLEPAVEAPVPSYRPVVAKY